MEAFADKRWTRVGAEAHRATVLPFLAPRQPDCCTYLFQIGANKVNEIFCKFRSNLLLGAIGEMKSNVRLKDLSHQTVDATANCRKQHQLATAVLVRIDLTLDRLKLSAKTADSLEQFHFFSIMNRHRRITSCLDIPGGGIVHTVWGYTYSF